jgi:hypothetical protein
MYSTEPKTIVAGFAKMGTEFEWKVSAPKHYEIVEDDLVVSGATLCEQGPISLLCSRLVEFGRRHAADDDRRQA